MLKEDEIRPDILMKKQAEYFAADIRRLLKYKNRFVLVGCPACGGNRRRKAFDKHGITYVICPHCQTMYVNPRPTPDILEKYYTSSENYAYWNKCIFPASESVRRKHIFRPRAEKVVKLCEKYVPDACDLLEVGAGFGTFCEEIGRFKIFKRVVAVESTPDLARTCRKKGIDVIEGQVEQIDFSDLSFDVVTCFETIEHLFSPVDFILKCREMLRDSGLLIVSCPNVKGFEISVLRSESDSVDAEHLNYFNPESLSRLFTFCGFDVVEVCTPGRLDAELVRKKALANKIDLSSRPFLKKVLLEHWESAGSDFQDFLAGHNLSSHMFVVARKEPS